MNWDPALRKHNFDGFVQTYLIAISSLFDKTLRMRNEIQVWLSIICKTLQQSLTKAFEILRRATTQFLNRTPALI